MRRGRSREIDLSSVARWLLIIVLSVAAASTALAQGDINVICSAPIPWCDAAGGRVRQGNRHQGQHDAEGRRSVARPTGRGKNESQARRLVCRHRRLAPAGGGRGPHRRIPLRACCSNCRTGRCARRSSRSGMRLRSMPVRLASATTASRSRRSNCRSPGAGPILRGPNIADEVQIANPISSRTGYATIATFVQVFGEDKAFELLKGIHRNVRNYPRTGGRRNSRGGAGRNHHRGYVAARWRDGNRQRISDQAGCALRRDGLRGRLDEHRQGRAQSREREAVLRLGTFAGGAANRRRYEEFPDAVEQGDADSRRDAGFRRDEADPIRLRPVCEVRPNAGGCWRNGIAKSMRCRDEPTPGIPDARECRLAVLRPRAERGR